MCAGLNKQHFANSARLCWCKYVTKVTLPSLGNIDDDLYRAKKKNSFLLLNLCIEKNETEWDTVNRGGRMQGSYMCLWIRKKRVTGMRVRISCNRFPLRVSFISVHCQYSPCVRWPCSPSSSPRGKELHKTLSLSLPFLLVPSFILCAETGGRQGGKVCVLLSFVCVSWGTQCVSIQSICCEAEWHKTNLAKV